MDNNRLQKLRLQHIPQGHMEMGKPLKKWIGNRNEPEPNAWGTEKNKENQAGRTCEWSNTVPVLS